MNTQERLGLLEALQGLAPREDENNQALPERTFLPLPAHRLALRPEIMIVRGGRGAGKSALFKLLSTLGDTARLRRFFEDDRLPDATWLEAFAPSSRHPPEAALDAFGALSGSDALRAFWMAHLLLRLAEDHPDLVTPPLPLQEAWRAHRGDLTRWVPVAQANLSAIAQALDQTERALEKKRQTVFATYDHLDRIGAFDAHVRRRYVEALLPLWLSNSTRYRHLRAKIFLRDDLLDAGELSKLRARSVSIDWDVASLYRVVVRHAANASEELRQWLRPLADDVALEERGEFGWMPGVMSEEAQRAFVTRFAGEVMGAGVKKGYTYRWIPNHLQDAQARIFPRSMLFLFGFAAREAAKHPLDHGVRLVTQQDIGVALEATSRVRIDEIQEECKLVQRLANLRGLSVILDPDVVMNMVSLPVADEPPGLVTDGKAVLDELVRLGVLSVRSDGRIDVPDIYRSGFGILRKGGTARAQ